jgi:hypothetical protein
LRPVSCFKICWGQIENRRVVLQSTDQMSRDQRQCLRPFPDGEYACSPDRNLREDNTYRLRRANPETAAEWSTTEMAYSPAAAVLLPWVTSVLYVWVTRAVRSGGGPDCPSLRFRAGSARPLGKLALSTDGCWPLHATIAATAMNAQLSLSRTPPRVVQLNEVRTEDSRGHHKLPMSGEDDCDGRNVSEREGVAN